VVVTEAAAFHRGGSSSYCGQSGGRGCAACCGIFFGGKDLSNGFIVEIYREETPEKKKALQIDRFLGLWITSHKYLEVILLMAQKSQGQPLVGCIKLL